MRVRRYQAVLPKEGPFRPWRDCLELARKECIGRAHAELGSGAVFLNEETRVEERLLGIIKRDIVEMLFATDLEGTALEGQGRPLPVPVPSERTSDPAAAPAAAAATDAVGRLEGEVRDLSNTVRALVREVAESGFAPLEIATIAGPGSKDESQASGLSRHPDLRALLIEAEVPEPLLSELLAQVPEAAQGAAARRALLAAIAERIAAAPFGEPAAGQANVIALVGPTGVGKTTTIAKLAAPYALSRKRRIGLVTLDTYRIAAVEQLRTYAEIMDVPVRVAHGRKDIVQALQSLSGCDLIFLDTAGRSQKNREQVAEMEKVLEGIRCEPHLVVSATTKPRDLHEIVREFSAVRFRSLILTKLDETNTLGPALELITQTGLSVSYVTAGQRVPEDIEAADPHRFAARLLRS